MNIKTSLWLPFSLFCLGQAVCAVSSSNAGGFDLNSTSGAADSKAVSSGSGDAGVFGRQKFTLTFDSRFGYDSNTLGQPDSTTVRILNANTGLPQNVTVNTNKSDSAFLNFALGLGYTLASPRLTLTLGGDVGVNYFFDRPGRSYDVNGGLSARLTYKLTPRLFLDASSYNAYESQGDFGATNLTGFTGTNFGGRAVGTTAGLDGDYFYTTDRVALTYQFAPRLSAVFSNTLVAFAYDDSFYAQAQDRIEEYPSLELQYLLQPNLSLALDYRFGYVHYLNDVFNSGLVGLNNVSNDSQTHFILAGFDYSANERLHASLRAGVEIRSYFDYSGADETSPYAEGNLSYDLSRNAHLALSTRYGIEEGDLGTVASKSDTFRIGIDYTQNFTARISGYAGFYYTHSRFENEAGEIANFNEDSYDVAVGARYAINRHFAAEIGYTYSNIDSDLNFRSYDRHRVFAGVRFSY